MRLDNLWHLVQFLDSSFGMLVRGVGNLCIGRHNDPRYDARRMVELVIAGLRLH
jgi:hypothetical protein